MAERGVLVAARFLDGRVVKGWTQDLRPDEKFSLFEDGTTVPTRLSVSELKAVFYIKSLGGNPRHDERMDFERRTGVGEKIWVEFLDGEKLAGWSFSYRPDRDGFFVYPTDPDSNINSAYVFRSALRGVGTGRDAEQAARDHEARRIMLQLEQHQSIAPPPAKPNVRPEDEPDTCNWREFSYSPEDWDDFLGSSGV